MNNRQKIYKFTCIFLLIDQIIKIIIKRSIIANETITIIKDFFYLTNVKNTGAAFSILENETLFLVILSVIFILILDKFIKKEEANFTKIEVLSLGLILGGIFGNLIDRIINRGVIDYLSFEFFSYLFPVFNFADICITVGAIIFILVNIFNKKESRKNNGIQR